MLKTKIKYLKIAIALFAIMYLCAIFLVESLFADIFRIIFLGLVFILYSKTKKEKQPFFCLFLLFFLLADLNLIVALFSYDIAYYLGNSLYIIAYVFLIIHLVFKMNLKRLLQKNIYQIIVLFCLGTYLFYSLISMLNHHTNLIRISDFIIEYSYNLIIILVLIFSLLHYLYFMNKKSLVFFMAGMFLSFSELIHVAYLFVEAPEYLRIIYSVVFFAGLYFVYLYVIYLSLEEEEDFEA